MKKNIIPMLTCIIATILIIDASLLRLLNVVSLGKASAILMAGYALYGLVVWATDQKNKMGKKHETK